MSDTTVVPINDNSTTSPSGASAIEILESTSLFVCHALQSVGGAAAVLHSLEAIYSVWNAAHTKQQWTTAFIKHIKIVENEIIQGKQAFKQQHYLDQLNQVLIECESALRSVLSRSSCSSFLFSLGDRSLLQSLIARLEELKQRAVLGQIIEVKIDIHNANDKTKQIKQLLKGADAVTSNAIEVSSTSSSSFKSVAPSALMQGAALTVCSLLSHFGSGKSICGPLTTIYDIWNAGINRSAWTSEFLHYVQCIECEIVLGNKCFRHTKFIDDLSLSLSSMSKQLRAILARSSFLAFVTSASDRATLAQYRSKLENIKLSALNYVLTETKEDTVELMAEVKQLKEMIASQQYSLQQREAEIQQQYANDHLMRSQCEPIEFEIDFSLESSLFVSGTRSWLFSDYTSWQSDSSGAHARIFHLSGDAGVGKTNFIVQCCNQFTDNIMAIHLCKHDSTIKSSPRRLLKNLAYQLMMRIESYKNHMLEVLSYTSLQSSNVSELFEVLFLQPFLTLHSRSVNTFHSLFPDRPLDVSGRAYAPVELQQGNAVCVIDAIDELQGNEVDRFMQILQNDVNKLPSYICFLVTSRPSSIPLFPSSHHTTLTCQSANNLNDLSLCLNRALSKLVQAHELSEIVAIMQRKLQGMFLYYHILVEQLESAHDRLSANSTQLVYLSRAHFEALPAGLSNFFLSTMQRIAHSLEHTTYLRANSSVLSKSMMETNGQHFEFNSSTSLLPFLLQILSVALAAYTPLPLSTLCSFFHLPNPHVLIRVLSPFKEFFPIQYVHELNLEEWQQEQIKQQQMTKWELEYYQCDITQYTKRIPVITMFHKSIQEWLTHTDRLLDDDEKVFYVDLEYGHRVLLQQCYQQIFPMQQHTSATHTELDRQSSRTGFRLNLQGLTSDDSANTVLPSPPFLPIPSEQFSFHATLVPSSFLSYALHFAPCHALALCNIPVLACFLCHLQYLYLRFMDIERQRRVQQQTKDIRVDGMELNNQQLSALNEYAIFNEYIEGEKLISVFQSSDSTSIVTSARLSRHTSVLKGTTSYFSHWLSTLSFQQTCNAFITFKRFLQLEMKNWVMSGHQHDAFPLPNTPGFYNPYEFIFQCAFAFPSHSLIALHARHFFDWFHNSSFRSIPLVTWLNKPDYLPSLEYNISLQHTHLPNNNQIKDLHIYAINISPNQQYVAVLTTHSILKIYQVHDMCCIFTEQFECAGVLSVCAWSHDSTYLAIGGYRAYVRIWNVNTQECHQQLDERTHTNPDGVQSILFTLDDQHVIFAGYNPHIYIYARNLSTTNRLTLSYDVLTGHTHWLSHLVLSSDGNTLFSGGVDGRLEAWQLKAGDSPTLSSPSNIQCFTHHTAPISTLCAHPTHPQQFLSSSEDETIVHWSISSHVPIAIYSAKSYPQFEFHFNKIAYASWNADATVLYLFSSHTNSLTLFDVSSSASSTLGVVLGSFERFPVNTYLITCSNNINTHKQLKSNSMKGQQFVFTASHNNELSVWNMSELKKQLINSNYDEIQVLTERSVVDSQAHLARESARLLQRASSIISLPSSHDTDGAIDADAPKQPSQASASLTCMDCDTTAIYLGYSSNFIHVHDFHTGSFQRSIDCSRSPTLSDTSLTRLNDCLYTLSLHPHLPYLLTVYHSSASQVYDSRTGQCIATLDLATCPRHTIKALAWNYLQHNQIIIQNDNYVDVWEFTLPSSSSDTSCSIPSCVPPSSYQLSDSTRHFGHRSSQFQSHANGCLVTALCLHHTGHYMCTIDRRGNIKMWQSIQHAHINNSKQITHHQKHDHHVHQSHNAFWHSVPLWSHQIHNLNNCLPVTMECCSLNHDGSLVGVGGGNCHLVVFDTITGQCEYSRMNGDTLLIEWMKLQNYVAVLDTMNNVNIYDVEHDHRVLEIREWHSIHVESVGRERLNLYLKFLLDDTRLVLSSGESVKVWLLDADRRHSTSSKLATHRNVPIQFPSDRIHGICYLQTE